jgi:hypothetical protein
VNADLESNSQLSVTCKVGDECSKRDWGTAYETVAVDIYVMMGLGFDSPPVRKFPICVVKVRSAIKGKTEEARYDREHHKL